MSRFRRALTPGATWFFTLNLARRRGNTLLIDHGEVSRDSLRRVKQHHPCRIGAFVVWPKRLHARTRHSIDTPKRNCAESTGAICHARSSPAFANSRSP